VSAALSGCGIMPKTLRSKLQIPAMLSRDPFGLNLSFTLPALSQYLKIIWSFLIKLLINNLTFF